jgi:hypothetical protein
VERGCSPGHFGWRHSELGDLAGGRYCIALVIPLLSYMLGQRYILHVITLILSADIFAIPYRDGSGLT